MVLNGQAVESWTLGDPNLIRTGNIYLAKSLTNSILLGFFVVVNVIVSTLSTSLLKGLEWKGLVFVYHDY